MCNNHGEVSRFTLWSSTTRWPKHNCRSWRKSFLRFSNDSFLRWMSNEMFSCIVRTSLRLHCIFLERSNEKRKEISERTSIMSLKAFVSSAVGRLIWRRIFGWRPNKVIKRHSWFHLAKADYVAREWTFVQNSEIKIHVSFFWSTSKQLFPIIFCGHFRWILMSNKIILPYILCVIILI